MIWAALPKELRRSVRAVAARDYWTQSPFRQWLTTAVFNVIYVSREHHADEDPLEPLIDAMNAGDSLILFPEGTRGYADEPQAFKAGLYNLALKFPEVELVPAWINNVQRVMPIGDFWCTDARASGGRAAGFSAAGPRCRAGAARCVAALTAYPHEG